MDEDDGSRGSSAGGGGGRSSGAAASANVMGRGHGSARHATLGTGGCEGDSDSQRTAPGGEMVMLAMWEMGEW